MAFPFDFGFITGTLGDDGDPLDVLLLMEQPAFVGCLVPSTAIGVIEAKQTEEGKTIRNDRLIAVAAESNIYKGVTSIRELHENVLGEIEHFFVAYNEMSEKRFVPIGRGSADKAIELIKEGHSRHKHKN